jgi:hypothetical protein
VRHHLAFQNDPDKATVKMSSSILPHLLYLKATFGNLAASTRKDPIVELQIRAARRLLDYMMTQISAAPACGKNAMRNCRPFSLRSSRRSVLRRT